MSSYPNGRVPASALTPIPGGRLRSGTVARSWLALQHYVGTKKKVWLRPTGPNSSYRDLATQKRYYQDFIQGRGPRAAVPGTSNHGAGGQFQGAVDLPTPAMQMKMRQYGAAFGWGIAGNRLGSDAPGEVWHSCYRGPQKLTPKARYWFWRYKRAQKRKKR